MSVALRTAVVDPPRCLHHIRYRAGCKGCMAWERWRWGRRRDGLAADSRYPARQVRAHIRKLYKSGQGMPLTLIADRAGVSRATIRHIRSGRAQFVTRALGDLILAVTFDPSATRAGDPTGTLRRLDILAWQRWSDTQIAPLLGYTQHTIRGWRRRRAVPAAAAADVTALFERLRDTPGPASRSISDVQHRGGLPARFFTDANLDDPRYDPFAVLTEPVGVRRMLRALAVVGQGPEQVGAHIGEPADVIEKWTADGEVPCYAVGLVTDVYERLATTPGPDVEAADRARHNGWASALAWDDVDVHRPNKQPHHDAPEQHRPRKDDVLDSVVFDALDGHTTAAAMTVAERRIVVTILSRRGLSDRQIGEQLRWSDTSQHSCDAVTTFRRNHNINVTRLAPTLEEPTMPTVETLPWGDLP